MTCGDAQANVTRSQIVFFVPLQIAYYNNIDIYCSLINVYCSFVLKNILDVNVKIIYLFIYLFITNIYTG